MSITPIVPQSWLSSLPSGIWSGENGLPVLPYLPGQDVTVKKSPTWSTNVKRVGSGRERRTPMWPYALWNFELTYEVVRHKPTNDELFALWEFFNTAQGKNGAWLFVDPSDNQVSNQAFGTGDGATTTFQLSRSIRTWSEPVYGVYSPVVEVAGTVTSVTVVPNGAVTFATPPASGHVLTWSGYFYFGCRFDQDDLQFEQIVTQLWSGKSLKFVSLRP